MPKIGKDSDIAVRESGLVVVRRTGKRAFLRRDAIIA